MLSCNVSVSSMVYVHRLTSSRVFYFGLFLTHSPNPQSLFLMSPPNISIPPISHHIPCPTDLSMTRHAARDVSQQPGFVETVVTLVEGVAHNASIKVKYS